MRSLDRSAWSRGYRLDMALAVGFTTLAVLEIAFSPTFEDNADARLVVFVLMQTSLLGLRRQYPLSVHLVACVGLALQANWYPTGTTTEVTLITLYSAAAYATPPRALASVIVTIVDIYWVVSRFDVWNTWSIIDTSVLWLGVGGLGMFARLQQTESDRRTRRLTQLEEERRTFRERAVADERVQMARELHDAVGHSVTGILLLAGALRNVDEQPTEVREAIEAIERSGTDAMIELEALIGLLRSDDDHAHQPMLRNLDRLFARARTLGLEVEADIDVDPSLPRVIDRAAFRIVQESLTNAAKYANPALVSVAIRSRADSIDIEIVNPTVAESFTTLLSGGRGLIGMHERISILGGHLDVGPTGDNRFGVRASLPIVAGRSETQA